MRTPPTARNQLPTNPDPRSPLTPTILMVMRSAQPPPRPDAAAALLRRVLRLGLLAADARHGVVGRQRRLGEPDRDQRDLAVEAGHVAGRIDAGQVRLAAL